MPGRPQYWRAYRAGVHYRQRHLGTQVAVQVQRDLWHGHGGRAARGVLALLRWSPRTVTTLLRSPRRFLAVAEWSPDASRWR